MICKPCGDAANRQAPADQHCGDEKCMCGHRTDRYQTAPTVPFETVDGAIAAQLRAQAGVITADTWRQLVNGPEAEHLATDTTKD
ncbi:MAG: hypothetical protein HOW97_12300 [Catenulispora sp.]|nr:hypothetical protein [Catenulispora sp.]